MSVHKVIKAYWVVPATIFFFWLFWAVGAPKINGLLEGSPSLEKAGQWGDTFGAFNALFGALGFAAVGLTLLVQMAILKLQQDDLHRQRFEATFFELLRLIREARKEVQFEYGRKFMEESHRTQLRGEERFGQSAFDSAADEIEHWAHKEITSNNELTRESLAKLYEKYVHTKSEVGLGPYFRLIYNIMRRIKNDSVLTGNEKVEYANMLRGHLNSSEIVLLGFNGLSTFSKDLHEYIEHFHFLKYITEGNSRQVLKTVYSAKAFSARDD